MRVEKHSNTAFPILDPVKQFLFLLLTLSRTKKVPETSFFLPGSC